MTTLRIPSRAAVAGAVLAAIALSACGSDEDNDRSTVPAPARYTVTVTNLTANQPLAPAAVILHRGGYIPWRVGQAASPGLEVLAESGAPTDLLAEAAAASGVLATTAGAGVVVPGASDTLDLEGEAGGAAVLEVLSMLVNTNDGFAAVAGLAVDDLPVGGAVTRDLLPYDAGTERNDETAATVPGPAGGGEGFSQAAGEGFVAVHPGVVTAADGLVGSALGESHRFQSPVGRVRVVRTR